MLVPWKCVDAVRPLHYTGALELGTYNCRKKNVGRPKIKTPQKKDNPKSGSKIKVLG